jgi:uncharacterized repeat protein (TIGR01451 family)
MSNPRRPRLVPIMAVLALSGLRPSRLTAGPSVAVADVSIAKTVSGANPVHPGDVMTFSITVSNAGPDDATNVLWSDDLPPNTTLDEFDPPSGSNCASPPSGGTGTINCAIASLPANTSAGPFVIQLLPSGAGTVSNTATVTTDTFDPDPDNNSSTAVGRVDLNAVPTASGWALGVLALAMAAGGTLVLRR